jgi:hypothetical protein
MGVSCIVDCIMGRMVLVGEQNVTNHMGVRINPMAQFQPTTHVCMFKMLNALDAVWIHSFCVWGTPDCHVQSTKAGRNSSCSSAWTLLYQVNNVFIFLHILLYLTFSTAVYTRKGTFFSQMLVNTSEHTSVRDSSLRVL